MRNAVVIDKKDNVAVAIEPIAKGDEIVCGLPGGGEARLTAAGDITIYHKLALHDIPAGGKIVKYGQHIGEAACDIPAGAHVHEHNVASVREDLSGLTGEAAQEDGEDNPVYTADTEPVFYGYARPDGRVGIRNHVLVLPASVCASDVTNRVAAAVPGAVSFHNQNGCSQVGADQQWTMDIMSGYAANPNVYGTVVISLGCENCQMDLVVEAIREKTNKPLRQIIIQEVGGTVNATALGIRMAAELVEEAKAVPREPFPVSKLILGTECGGSDPTSGLAANPLIGSLSDRLVDLGGTSILSETTEFIGGEHILANRSATPEVHDRILFIVKRFEDSLAQVGELVRHGNPSPGNKAGGLTTLEEKSLGCIHKGGHRPVQAVYDYAKPIPTDQKGLVIMDTPGNDPSSVAGMVAGGAQVVIFSSGRGTPTGHPLAPVIKITGNRETAKKMAVNLDIDASPVIYGTKNMEQMTDEAFSMMVDVANGKQTKAESMGFVETAIARVCNYV